MNRVFFKFSIFIFCFGLSFDSFSQTITDSAAAFPFVRFQYSRIFSGGDFEETFGDLNDVGGAIGFKTKSNWQFDIESTLFFGADVKRKNMLSGIINSEGDVTNSNGELIKLVLEIRGYTLFSSIGKIFPLSQYNQNSGIIVKVGAGYLQHRIKVDFRDGTVFQLSDENLKGFDRLHTGFALRQFVGYQYYGVKNLLSFYVGFEFNQGFTYNRRQFNFDERASDTDQKQDFLSGIRFGWTIPIRSRASEEFYYY